MSLKLLLVPASILISFAIMVAFIRPDIASMQEKKELYATKLVQTENMDTLLSNVDALSMSLEGNKEAERFIVEYLPKQRDEERVIDAFNFVGSQSGVAVTTIVLGEVETQEQVDDVADMTLTDASVAGADATSVLPTPLVSGPKVESRSYSAQVSVIGRYDNIKDFMARVVHLNRMHKTRTLAIEKLEKSEDVEGEQGETDILLGRFVAEFDYFDAQVNYNALYAPVFSQASFDMNAFDKVTSWVTEIVPMLEKPTTGRPNPFQ